MFFKRKPIVVTHNGHFHADDLCAVATLHILLNGKYKLIRTRDPEIIAKADYVVDVGGEHDPARQRFDHHQSGGAGARPNTIPYAAFGLVWKEYGSVLCGSDETALEIDNKIVAQGDALDNGVEIMKRIYPDIFPYQFMHFLSSFNPLWNEPQDFDGHFKKALPYAITMLRREINKENSSVEGKKHVEESYEKAADKRIVELNGNYPWRSALSAHPEPLYVVKEEPDNGYWTARAVPVEKEGFAVRKPFPAAWAGLRDADLAKVSGVPDAIFCHNKLFLAVAKSREGALALAKLALEG